MRKLNQCPQCMIDADLIPPNTLDKRGYKLIFSDFSKQYKCPRCDMVWEINERFECLFCSKEIPDRVLFCSIECEKEAIKDMENQCNVHSRQD